ncbi:hypothetical protein E4L96_20735 [Massilia arenosa]|uniref:2OG-Fe(II) oxygenase n=1 Tax=Zemynaea arenosa TaxID=2561931 RepID=A0A4Y9RV15_9BURK|nr:DUF6445 family protein [Massilia arenosa]TFW11626.1 hypothetical protein E4L96_20735 [Massilia arenosa]
MRQLSYRKPQQGRDYWVADDFLPNAPEVAARSLARHDWELGAPYTQLPWPGKRSPAALTADEMAHVEAWVRKVTGAKKLWQEQAPEGRTLNHNYVQLVGMADSGARPHTDSRALCRYAAVIYLSPEPEPDAGTSFYRQRYPSGQLGGNMCSAPHTNLREALGVARLPPQAWQEEVRVENRFNRILLYRANLVHSATSYFGFDDHEKRMTAVFFWMA